MCDCLLLKYYSFLFKIHDKMRQQKYQLFRTKIGPVESTLKRVISQILNSTFRNKENKKGKKKWSKTVQNWFFFSLENTIDNNSRFFSWLCSDEKKKKFTGILFSTRASHQFLWNLRVSQRMFTEIAFNWLMSYPMLKDAEKFHFSTAC